jgi:hypothetical protein
LPDSLFSNNFAAPEKTGEAVFVLINAAGRNRGSPGNLKFSI